MDACDTRPSGVQVVAFIGPIPNPQLNWGFVTYLFVFWRKGILANSVPCLHWHKVIKYYKLILYAITLEACCIEEQENGKVHGVNKCMLPIKNAFGLYYIILYYII